jgi:hypothetical protein
LVIVPLHHADLGIPKRKNKRIMLRSLAGKIVLPRLENCQRLDIAMKPVIFEADVVGICSFEQQ